VTPIQQRAREWGGHLVHEVRQLCQLGVHLERLRLDGKIELHDAVDAAALEAFVLHARSLIDFAWHSNDADVRRARQAATEHGAPTIGRAPRRDDVLAEHYFDKPSDWNPGEMTRLLAHSRAKVGWGVAHCSYTRLEPEEARGWEHGQITRDLVRALHHFMRRAERHHLDRRHSMDIGREISRALTNLPIHADDPLQAVATPWLVAPGECRDCADPLDLRREAHGLTHGARRPVAARSSLSCSSVSELSSSTKNVVSKARSCRTKITSTMRSVEYAMGSD
jgi:hypothetical protein